jgi:DNA-directed RNA polymerase subunit K/omega
MVNPEVPNEIITRNTLDYEKRTNNVYESIAVISKRANQIAAKVKEELSDKLQEFQTTSDNLEEVFENREQIEISKFYERQPKATLVALEEFLESKIYHRNPLKES